MVGRATKRGRPKKPAHQRQGHRAVTGVVLRASDVAVAAPIPPPPVRPDGDPLCDAALVAWDAFWQSDLRQALDGIAGVDRIQVDRWARLLDEHERLWADIQRSPTVPGSKGQPRINPKHTILQETLKNLERQEGVLGLTPADRARLGISFAASTAASIHVALLREATGDG